MNIRLTIALRTHSILNAKVHWAHRARKARVERRAAALALRAAHPAQLSLLDIMGPIDITLTRLGPSAGLDCDNLAAAFKSVRDGVADWLQIDDGDQRLRWSYRQGRADCWAVRIEVLGPDAVPLPPDLSDATAGMRARTRQLLSAQSGSERRAASERGDRPEHGSEHDDGDRHFDPFEFLDRPTA